MKKIFFLTTVLCLILSGCMTDTINEDAATNSEHQITYSTGIIVRASKFETFTESDIKEPVVFTGNDMLWFNESTREMRFHNNVSMRAAFTNVEALKFYISDDFLFSTLVNVNGTSAQNINSLTFYYNAAENKYYLLGSFPTSVELDNTGPVQELPSDVYTGSEWEKFIDQLKKDGKLQ